MMKMSIFFLVVFVICVILGNVIDNWWDWLTGLVFGLAIYQVAPKFVNFLEHKLNGR